MEQFMFLYYLLKINSRFDAVRRNILSLDIIDFLAGGYSEHTA